MTDTPCRENPSPRRSHGEKRENGKLYADDWFVDESAGRDTEPGKQRRRAKQACWTDCPMKARLICLHEGMQEENLNHGIWGGYDPSDRLAIDAAITERGLNKGRFLQAAIDSATDQEG